LLRYDAHRALVNPISAETKAFPKPYFHFTLFAYLLGIVLTVFVMSFFNSAQVSSSSPSFSLSLSLSSQPALLYLVPACLLSTVLVGLWKQDMTHLWEYDEAKIYEEARAKLTQIEEQQARVQEESESNLEVSQKSLEVEDKKER
jgi:minor histocompatibility antigen H13